MTKRVAGAFWARLRRPNPDPPEQVSIWRKLAVVAGWGAAASTVVLVGLFTWITWGMPSTDDIWDDAANPSITYLDRNGQTILREGAQSAPPIRLEELPKVVPQAFVAIEDRRFYNHMGVDFGGLIRAMVENVQAGRVVQGGSTITQQLAKNLFLTNQRTFRRKAQEVALALWLEQRFSKDEILALYLSRVYFGAGAYGIEAAAERYFAKPAQQLTLPEAALLAGLLKAPSRLDPTDADSAATLRAVVVLDTMVEEEFITKAERDTAAQAFASLRVSTIDPRRNAGYFRAWIDPQLRELIGEERGDFIVETTLDIDAQRSAEQAVSTVLNAQGEQLNANEAGAVILDEFGGVRAMVGGRGFQQSQFNRVTQARRQPGSSFKYFIYLAAMDQGISPWAIRVDRPLTIGDWSPGNYEERYMGPVELSRAYAASLNMVAIELALEVGGERVIETARRLGVRAPLENYRSLALGAQEMTLMEMTAAYGAMASGGYRVDPHGIQRVRRAGDGTVIWERGMERGERVIEERSWRAMNLMMARVVQAGTATRARIPGRSIGGKTGTGNDYRDAWFVGYTSGLVAGVWVGNDDFSRTRRVTGGSLPAEIWRSFMPTALRGRPDLPLPGPSPSDFPPQAAPDPGLMAATESGDPALETASAGMPLTAPRGTPQNPDEEMIGLQ
jgi:penicillin-binding protein 1A